MADIGSIRATLELNMQGWNTSMSRAQSDLQNTGRMARDTSKSFGDISKAGLVLGGAVVGALGASVKQAASFEFSMSKVKAITNATDEQFSLLSDTAQELGAKTAYSSEQVSEAMYNLGASGYSTNQIIAAMPGLLNLAAAAQVDLGTASDITSGIMSAFGLEAEKTGYIVDVLAQAANSSNASIPQLGEAFKYVGPVAKSLGLSVEEVAASLGVMHNAGIKGSDAGTALRASLLALANPVGAGAKAIEALGIKVTTADGKMKPLPELIATIGGKLKGMTDAQKTATVAQLVGTEAASGFLSLISAGPDKLKSFEKSLKDSGGTAEKVAKTQMDNLNGQLEQFRGALSSIGVEIGQDFLPALTDVAKKAAEVISKMDDADLANLKAGLSFGGTAAAILTTGGALGKMAFAVRGLLLTMGPIGFAIGGLALVAGAIAAVVVKNKEMEAARMKNIEAGFKEVNALDESINKYDALKSKSALTNDEFGRYLDLQSEIKRTSDPTVIAKLKDEMAKLQDKSGLSNKELSDMVGLNGDLIEKVPEATKAITKQGNAVIESTKSLKKFNNEKLQGLYDKLDLEKIKNETEYKDLLDKEVNLVKDRKTEEEKLRTLQKEKVNDQKIENEKTHTLNEMKKEGSGYTDAEVQNQQIKVNLAQDDVELAQKRIEKQVGIIQGTDTELEKTREKLKKIEDISQKMAQIVLKQEGLNSEKGKEISAIDTAIGKLQVQKKELEKNTTPAQRNTQEYKNSASAIDEQIGKLQTARGKVENIYNAAKDMNAELAKAVTKWVTVYVQEQANRNKYMPEAQLNKQRYHTGGIVGKPPQLHVGGLAAQFASAPNHNEIDVRLLRNEAVLTEAQQSNLMRMIDAGQTLSGSTGGGVTKEDFDRLASAMISVARRPVTVEVDGQEIGKISSAQMARDLDRAYRMSGFKG